jgi:hypothetical protein
MHDSEIACGLKEVNTTTVSKIRTDHDAAPLRFARSFAMRSGPEDEPRPGASAAGNFCNRIETLRIVS